MLCQGSLKLYPVNVCAALVFSFEMNIVTLITIYGELKHYRFKLSWCIILSLINYYNDNISSRTSFGKLNKKYQEIKCG